MTERAGRKAHPVVRIYTQCCLDQQLDDRRRLLSTSDPQSSYDPAQELSNRDHITLNGVFELIDRRYKFSWYIYPKP